MKKKYAHIINPVIAGKESDLFVAQPITFESMRIAQKYSQDIVEVELVTAQFEEDRPVIPEFFIKTPNLSKSIQDIIIFNKKRKLPLIKDILDRLYEASDAEYFIYTNVDIALMPFFYVAITNIIDSGYDAFVITRRTIEKKYGDTGKLHLMFSQVGEKHRGHDCFVFKSDFYKNFKLGTACIGADWVGKILIANLINSASNFSEFKNLHLTFHLGNDRIWKDSKFTDYNLHNAKVLNDVIRGYLHNRSFAEHPTINKYLIRLQENYGLINSKQRNKIKKERRPFNDFFKINPSLKQNLKSRISLFSSIQIYLKLAWRGFLISLCLLLYSMSSLPGCLLASYLCVLPFLIDLNIRYIKLVKHQIKKGSTNLE